MTALHSPIDKLQGHDAQNGGFSRLGTARQPQQVFACGGNESGKRDGRLATKILSRRDVSDRSGEGW
jgi:hypothetical protein